MKYSIYLPLFEGFYNTLLEPDESAEMHDINSVRDEEAPFEAFEFDYDGYKKKVGENACAYIEEQLIDIGLKVSIEYNDIWSPKEYNFENDRVECTIEVDIERLKGLFFESFDKEWAREKFASRDGFSSFYPELKHLRNWSVVKEFENVHIESMIECILLNHEGSYYERDDYINSCLEEANLYCVNREELINNETTKQYKTYSVVDVDDERGNVVFSSGLDLEEAQREKSHYDERYDIEAVIVEDEPLKSLSAVEVIEHAIDKMVEMALDDEFPLYVSSLNPYQLAEGIEGVIVSEKSRVLVQLTDDEANLIGLIYTSNFPRVGIQWEYWLRSHDAHDLDDFVDWYNDEFEDQIEREFALII